MNSKLTRTIVLGLLVILTLAGCGRSRLRVQGSQSPAGMNGPAAATQPSGGLIQTPAEPPSASQSRPQPGLVAPSAPSSDFSPAADDLLSSLDGLSKDLDATDTLNDVK